jgi:hypothetical protein
MAKLVENQLARGEAGGKVDSLWVAELPSCSSVRRRQRPEFGLVFEE